MRGPSPSVVPTNLRYMRLSAQPECSRALMHASMIACVISSTFSELIPISRARLPAARAAAISMSGTMGRLSSIWRSAVGIIAETSWSKRTSEREKERGDGLDPVGEGAQTVERDQRQRVHPQHRGEKNL